jgi:hypothetical protein
MGSIGFSGDRGEEKAFFSERNLEWCWLHGRDFGGEGASMSSFRDQFGKSTFGGIGNFPVKG